MTKLIRRALAGGLLTALVVTVSGGAAHAAMSMNHNETVVSGTVRTEDWR